MLGRPVEITFEFDYSRNFTAIHLHMNNYFTKDVQVRSTSLHLDCVADVK